MDEHSKTRDALSRDVEHGSLVNSTRLTVVTAVRPRRISKAFELDDTGKLVKLSGGQLVEGTVKVHGVRDLVALAEIINGLTPAQALIHGIPEAGITRLMSREQFEAAGRPDGCATRTNEDLAWPPGPGVMMIDYDPVPEGRAMGCDELIEALRAAVPGLREASMLWIPSASSCIFHGEKELRGVEGQRLYLLVEDAADIPRAGQVLQDRLWLAGHGRVVISKSGALLERTLVDGSVWQPSRLDFAGGAECMPPLRQARGAPVIIPGSSNFVDSRNVFLPLSAEERKRLNRLKTAARQEAEPHRMAAREAWVDERVREMRDDDGTDDPEFVESARRQALRALDQGVLHGDFVIHIARGDVIENVPVKDVLDDPRRYDGMLTRDPLEPDYDGGRSVGKLFLQQRRPTLHSFAHGGRTYRLERSLKELELPDGRTAQSVDQTVAILHDDPALFDYGDQLALVQSGRLYPLGEDALANYLGGRIQYWEFKGAGDKARRKDCDPPKDLVKQILALGHRRGLNPLDGIVTGPLVRPDGSILAQPGYDPATRLVLDVGGAEIPPIPMRPSIEEARRTLDQLMRPFREFPLAGGAARGALLAAALTTVVRAGITTAPAFGFDAPVQGSGKTLLARCIGALAEGRDPDIWPHTRGRDDEETRKRLFTVLREGSRVLLWDNITGHLDSASLAAFITAPSMKDRILGQSASMQIPNRVQLLLTGNNLTLEGDLPRRVITCRIAPNMEEPFARQFDLDPLAHVLEHRMEMLAAACTLIRARFTHPIEPAPGRLAGFEAWDDLVRQTVHWVNAVLEPGMFGDPMEIVREATAKDSVKEALLALLVELREQFCEREFSAREVHDHATDGTSLERALTDLADDTVAMSSRRIGRLLRAHEGRLVNGARLVSRHDAAGNARMFRVEGNLPPKPF